MVEPEKKRLGPGLPLFTALIGIAAVAAYILPSSMSFLIYDRTAIASGEIWRLVTGNLVHFSRSHLFLNLLVFFVVGWAVESRGFPYFRSLCTLSALLLGAGLYVLAPQIQTYGGLSGVACGAVVYLALNGLRDRGSWRMVSVAVLVLTFLKILLEYTFNIFFFVDVHSGDFLPVPLSHVVGSLTAIMIFGLHYCRSTYCKENHRRLLEAQD